MAQGVGNDARLGDALALGHEYLDGKLVAVGKGELSDFQRGHDEAREQDDADAAPDGEPRMAEGEVEHLVVGGLYPAGDCPAPASLLGDGRLDDQHLEEGDDGDGEEERHHEVDGDGDGEVLQGVVEGALQRQQQRVEDDADAERGEHHRHEILLGRGDGGLLGGVALADILQIAVDDDDGIVDDHAEHHDEGGEGDDVELNAHHIHDSH